MNGKKGQMPTMETFIFIILNIAFFGLMMFYISNNLSKDRLGEQAMAKQIALMLDNAEANTTFFVDISDIGAIAKKNDYSGELFSINESSGEIKLKLSRTSGYVMNYFTNYNISYSIQDKGAQKYLYLIVGEKNDDE